MNYYERHIGDYLKDTAHLSLLEHGIYGRLLDVYYTRECAIPVAQVERLIGVRSKDERAALTVVLDEFFTLEDDALHHKRCEREISKFQDKQRKASASANARWEKQKSHSDGNANGMRTHSDGNANGMHRAPVPRHQTPDTSNQTTEIHPPTPRKRGAVEVEGFALLWAQYPKKANKPAALKAYLRLGPSADLLDEMLAALAWQRESDDWRKAGGQFVPMASSWINGRRWEDEKPKPAEPFVSPRERAAQQRAFELSGGILGRAPTQEMANEYPALG